MKVYIGADHRGFALKEEIKHQLESTGVEVIDCGAHTLDIQDDYPDYAQAVAHRVVADTESQGVLICSSGVGVSIAANKVVGARAVLAHNSIVARSARIDNDANIVALGSDALTVEQARAIINTFLNTPYVAEERFARRINKLENSTQV
jgi:ribose 5-phosphate isomerase B